MARPSFASIFKHCAGNKVDVTTIYLGFVSNCDACPPWRMQPNRQSHPTFRTPPTWGTGDPPFFRPTRLEVALESNHAADPWPFQWIWMTGSSNHQPILACWWLGILLHWHWQIPQPNFGVFFCHLLNPNSFFSQHLLLWLLDWGVWPLLWWGNFISTTTRCCFKIQ